MLVSFTTHNMFFGRYRIGPLKQIDLAANQIFLICEPTLIYEGIMMNYLEIAIFPDLHFNVILSASNFREATNR